MTTVHTETSTERIPGRAWTVRIVGHGRSSASVTCSTAACRMPPHSEDLAGLRAFAARHAAAHAKAGLWAEESESVLVRVAGRFSRVDLRWRMRDYVRGLLALVSGRMAGNWPSMQVTTGQPASSAC